LPFCQKLPGFGKGLRAEDRRVYRRNAAEGRWIEVVATLSA
jgi:hypothetical protein